MSALPCAAYEIDTLDFALVLTQLTDLFLLDMAQRQKLAACSPVAWDGSEYGREL